MDHKIGIFAGAFDPIHNGHLELARQAISRPGLEKVYFLVEPRPRRKQGAKAIEHRIRMVQLAIKDDDKLGLIILEQPRFTINETLPVLQARFQDFQLHLLMGDDVAKHLADWPHISDLAASTELIVAVRKHNKTEVKKLLDDIKRIKGLNFRYKLIDKNLITESSSHIRTQLRRAEPPEGLPDEVYAYIVRQGLYISAEEP